MAAILRELVLVFVGSVVGEWAHTFFFKLASWLDSRIKQSWLKVALACLLGLAAYLVIPIGMGLLGL